MMSVLFATLSLLMFVVALFALMGKSLGAWQRVGRHIANRLAVAASVLGFMFFVLSIAAAIQGRSA